MPKKTENIIIYGASSFSRLMKHYFEQLNEFKVHAFCIDKKYLTHEKSIDELPILDFETIDETYPPEKFSMFVAIGYSCMRARKAMYDKAKEKGYSLVNYIDKSAVIDKSAILGENNVIFPQSTIEPFVNIGNNNIIWASVVISHNVSIGNHCFFASQTLIGGNCTIGDNSFFGFNSTCIQNIKIGKETLVGAKSLVLYNTNNYSKNIGIPSREISNHTESGILIP